ncbi:facilitated trehalose transporter Tret1-2 homolog [Drosophila innubila]|uniref:facilitated trehalose transporter Tret1-2 homolog n=1 Tax=Drosophila innubila TaxID=198719 RepID=UPI00148C72B2|nr:facilitated trehalose transporter Tret1-2 homolog [Drosophila innubila]
MTLEQEQLMPPPLAFQPGMAIICKDMDKTQLESNNNNNNNSKQNKHKSHKHKEDSLPLGERHLAVLRQELMVLLGNSGVLGSGMVVSMPSVTLNLLTDPTQRFWMNKDEASWFASFQNMACPIGGLLVSFFLDRIGRRYTILLTNLIGLIGWLLLATSFLHENRDYIYAQMLVGRAFGGMMIGMFVSPVGVYSAEISLPRIRGRLILGTSIGLASGILLMYVLGYFIRHNFVLIASISCAYQLAATLMVLPMPESPSWLLQKGQNERARRSLRYFRGLRRKGDDIVPEFEEELTQMKMTADNSRDTAASESIGQAIRRPEVYKPLLMMIGFFGFQQACGVVVIIVYAVQIAQTAGVTIDPVLVAVMLGVARIITTFFMSSIFEKWGRRPSGIFSATGMGFCMLLLAAGGWFPATVGTLSWLPVVCIVSHIVFSTMGMLTLPFIMISEVFPQSVRGSASGISVFFGMILAFVMLKIYPNMEAWLGVANLFAFYAIVSFLAAVFIYSFVPETRGRTLVEIEEHWRMGRRGRREARASASASAAVPTHLKDVELHEMFLKK